MITRAHISNCNQRLLQSFGFNTADANSPRVSLYERWKAPKFSCVTREWIEKFRDQLWSMMKQLGRDRVIDGGYVCGHFTQFAAWFANSQHHDRQLEQPHPDRKRTACAAGVFDYGEVLSGGEAAHSVIEFIVQDGEGLYGTAPVFFDPYPERYGILAIGREMDKKELGLARFTDF